MCKWWRRSVRWRYAYFPCHAKANIYMTDTTRPNATRCSVLRVRSWCWCGNDNSIDKTNRCQKKCQQWQNSQREMWSDDVKRRRRSGKENRKSFYTCLFLSLPFTRLCIADFAVVVRWWFHLVREGARRCERERLKTGVITKYIFSTTWNMKSTRNLFDDTLPHRVILIRLPWTIWNGFDEQTIFPTQMEPFFVYLIEICSGLSGWQPFTSQISQAAPCSCIYEIRQNRQPIH